MIYVTTPNNCFLQLRIYAFVPPHVRFRSSASTRAYLRMYVNTDRHLQLLKVLQYNLIFNTF